MCRTNFLLILLAHFALQVLFDDKKKGFYGFRNAKDIDLNLKQQKWSVAYISKDNFYDVAFSVLGSAWTLPGRRVKDSPSTGPTSV